jgi:zinc protease
MSSLLTSVQWASVLLVLTLCFAGCGSYAPRGDAKGTAVADDPASSASITEGVQSRRLSNGLTVLVKENHSAPVVAAVTWVKTGYFHEPDDVAGISHVVEHMYFNGTEQRPDPEAISRETKGYGGVLNAGTIYDHTSYYVVLPSENWREGLAVQADAYQHPLLDQKVLDNELEAILQEARRKLDSPSAFGREKMFELAFDKHRIRRWRIGTEEVLRDIDRSDLKRWYEDHYRPENTILSLVGDFQAEEVFAEVERLYGDHPKGTLHQRLGPTESAQTEFRYARMLGDLQRNYLFVGYHIPGEGHRDNAALDVLASILGQGRSSRLNRHLREDLGIVTSVSASSYRFEDVGIFELNALCDRDNLDHSSRELFVEVERMKLYGPTSEEVDRAKSILETSEVFRQEEVYGQASVLAAYQADGDFRLYDRELAQLREVTAAEVQRVAEEYLRLENATLFEYCPEWIVAGRESAEMGEHLRGAVLAAVREMEEPRSVGVAASLLPREELSSWSSRVAGATGNGVRHRYDLPNGGVLLVQEEGAVPTVTAGVYFRGGRTEEFPNIAGATELMQRVMVKQTGRRNPEQLAFESESLGTSVGRILREDYMGFRVDLLSRQAAEGFDLLFDVVLNPLFDQKQIVVERQSQVSAIRGLRDQSGAFAMQLARAALYDRHPYGLAPHGYEAAIKFFDANRLEEQYARVIRPETMVVVIVGDVKADMVHELVLQYIGRWTMGGTPRPADARSFYSKEHLETVPTLLFDREVVEPKERTQTAMVVAYPTVTAGDADNDALDVLQAITGGLGGTFFEEIRGRRGLAYQVSTFSAARAMGGFFGTFVACTPDSSDAVRHLVGQLHEGLVKEAPSQEFLDRAQNYLVGNYQIGRQTHSAVAGLLAFHELMGIDLAQIDNYAQRIRAVTREDLQRVAQTYFDGKPNGVGIVAGRSGAAANPK